MKNRLSINIKVLAGFGIAAMVVGYFLLTAYENAQLNSSEMRRKDVSLAVIGKSQDVLDDIQDIETGYRGFMITLNETYLEPSRKGFDNINGDLSGLRNSGSDNKLINILIGELSDLTSRKINYAQQLISLTHKNNINEATLLLKTGEGKRLMDNIRSHVTEIHSIAQKNLNASEEKTYRSALETKSNFLLLAIFILIVLIIFYLIIIRDIRRDAQTTKNLFSAGEQIRDLYDHAPSGYLSIANDKLITKINATALKWLGYTKEEVEGKIFLTQIVTEESAKSLRRVTENYAVSNIEIELIGKNKITYHVLLDSVSHKNKNGEITEKRIILTDISERKEAEEQIHYLAGLIDQTNDAIFSTDRKYIIRSWNGGAEKLYGYGKEDVINKESTILRSAIHADERKKVLEQLHDKGFWQGELTHYRKDGSPLYLYSSVSTVRNGQNQVTGYVTVAQDMTTRKIYEKKLQDLNSDLIEKVDDKTRQIVNLIERLTDGFIAIDNDWIVTHVNSVTSKILKKKRSEIIGRDIRTIWDSKENSFRLAINKSFQTQETMEVEDYYSFFKRWYYAIIYPDSEGISIFFRDVTKRKEAELHLQESEQKYRMIFENNPLPSWVLEKKTLKIIDVNEAAVKNYGYTKEEFLNLSVRDLRPPEDYQRLHDYLNSPVIGVQEPKIWTHLKKDGSIIDVEIFAFDMKVSDCDCRYVIAHDITDKLSAEAEILSSRDQLRQLSTHLEKIREEERATIAREIHDELGQQLTGLKMDISWVSKKIDNLSDAAKERIAGMLTLVDDTVKSVRRIASDLRPGILDDLGLTAALEWQTHEFNKRTGIECNFYSDVRDQVLDKNIAIGVFRIYQEALTNVARHANATAVNANLSRTNNSLKLFVNDNGQGIVKSTEKRKTLGLLGMRERALMMNGDLSINSEPGQGTKINLSVPLANNKLS